MRPSTTNEECWETGGNLCSWVYDTFDQNETAANLVSWAVDKPLTILLILLTASILSRLARRWVKRFVTRVVAPDKSSSDRLGEFGFDLPTSLSGDAPDPRRKNRAESISVVLTSTSVVMIWVIAGLLVLSTVGISLAPLIAGAGIAGVALGFGAQSLVRDCVSGLFVLIEDQYGIGDVIDLGEAVGTVEEVTLRTTVLRSLDGTVWHVPNGVVERVGNLSQLWSVALVDVDVSYDTDLDQARALLLRAATEVAESDEFRDQIVEAPAVLGVEALAADGITIRSTIKVEPGSQWGIQRAIRQRVKDVFDDAGIEIPFPQRTVWMKVPNDGPTDPGTVTGTST